MNNQQLNLITFQAQMNAAIAMIGARAQEFVASLVSGRDTERSRERCHDAVDQALNSMVDMWSRVKPGATIETKEMQQ